MPIPQPYEPPAVVEVLAVSAPLATIGPNPTNPPNPGPGGGGYSFNS